MLISYEKIMTTQSLGEASTALSPKAVALLVSHLLYFKFKGAGTAPILAGLDDADEPVLCTQGRLGIYVTS